MKHIISQVLLILCLVTAIASCQKAPELTITSPTNIELSADGSSGSITFTANRAWRVSSSDSWVTLSPSSGEPTDAPVTVSVRCSANTTYEDRTATVTITMEELSQKVTVRQPANKGIVLPTQVYDLQSDTRSIEVTVQANVDYTVETSVNWIKQTGTKGLTSKTLTFSIEENKTYDAREGKITIKPTQAGVAEQVISVKQAQKDALIVEKTSYDMPFGGGEIEIKVEANVAFDVTPNVEWLHHVSTKALSTSTVLIKVDENATYSAREGKIEIAQQDGSLKHTITVNQAGRIAVTSVELNQTNLTLKTEEKATLVATVKPDNATDKTVTWTSSDASIATVDETGKVTAIKDGSVTITAKAGERTAEGKIEVKTPSAAPDAIDLGLSVKWAPYNLGSTKPEEYGDFFAWGETEPRTLYFNYWDHYLWYDSANNCLTKYNTDKDNGDVDNIIRLDLTDDAANKYWGGYWRMPTKDELYELVYNCTFEWTSVNGVYGSKVTSNINRNSIFLPAAGQNYSIDQLYIEFRGEEGLYWSSTLEQSQRAYNLLVFSGGRGVGAPDRFSGRSIRPVYGEPIDPTEVQLDKTEIKLCVNNADKLIATFLPQDATYKDLTWSSNNISVVSVNSRGELKAISVGTATITVVTADGKHTASCTVTVTDSPQKPEAVDLGLSVKWASMNLGANAPEGSGYYYGWGETEIKEEYSWPNYKFYAGGLITSGTVSKYNTNASYGVVDNLKQLELSDDAAYTLLGDGWRIPTSAEFDELIGNCEFEWTSLNSVNGYMVKSKVNGNSIFLPAAGYAGGPDIANVGSGGSYWSSTLNPDQPHFAKDLNFDSTSLEVNVALRWIGFTIRPVTE